MKYENVSGLIGWSFKQFFFDLINELLNCAIFNFLLHWNVDTMYEKRTYDNLILERIVHF